MLCEVNKNSVWWIKEICVEETEQEKFLLEAQDMPDRLVVLLIPAHKLGQVFMWGCAC